MTEEGDGMRVQEEVEGKEEKWRKRDEEGEIGGMVHQHVRVKRGKGRTNRTDEGDVRREDQKKGGKGRQPLETQLQMYYKLYCMRYT